jgi:hypothetical protein
MKSHLSPFASHQLMWLYRDPPAYPLMPVSWPIEMVVQVLKAQAEAAMRLARDTLR